MILLRPSRPITPSPPGGDGPGASDTSPLGGPWRGNLTHPPTGALMHGGAAQGALVAPQPCRSAAEARAVQGEPAGATEPATLAPANSPTLSPMDGPRPEPMSPPRRET
jgi:hypothetical protein